MFLLSNYSRKLPLTVSKVNNRTRLELKDGSLSYIGTERNTPVKFYCFSQDSSEMGKIKASDLKPAKLMVMEVFCEKDTECTFEGTVEALVSDFASEKSKERFKKRELNAPVRAVNMKFNIENKLLPEFNHDAESVTDLYSLELMFSPEILQKFEVVEIGFEDFNPLIKKLPYSEDKRLLFVVMDCLVKFLSETFLSNTTIPVVYKFFHDEIRAHLIRGRLSSFFKDKLIVKLYILLLIAHNYKIPFEALPKFGLSKAKTVSILKAIGCTVSASDIVILSNMPQESISR